MPLVRCWIRSPVSRAQNGRARSLWSRRLGDSLLRVAEKPHEVPVEDPLDPHRIVGEPVDLLHPELPLIEEPEHHPPASRSEIHTDEQAVTAAAFWGRAVAWFAAWGITCERVLTDNGACYRSRAWAATCDTESVTHHRTRPYRPQTNGKVERFHRILLEEWAYIRPWTSERHRATGYLTFMHFYNHHRSHGFKEATVAAALDRFRPATVWDFGANTARYSRLASDRGIFTVAFDSDPGAVEIAYRGARDRGDTKLLPLVMDLANPSPSIGWAGEERASLTERGPADMGLALALVHHLVISNHIGFAMAARFFARTCRTLLVEFVPATDSQAMRLLEARRGPVPDYGSHAFERAFESYFSIEHVARIAASDRTLYSMTRRQQPLS